MRAIGSLIPKVGNELKTCHLSAWVFGLVIRRGHKKAIVAIAHKMIRTIYFMLTRRETYHDTGFDYAAANAKKNAPRWIKALETHGFVVKLSAAA